MTKLGQVLYGVTKKGTVKTWKCEVKKKGKEATITITTQTKLDGKKVVRNEEIKKGKNLGKKNETTPYEQACLEATSKYKKKIDKGYQDKIPKDTTQATCNSLGYPLPMLAKPIDKVKKIDFPAYLQPKLDGHRAIVTKQNGAMLMYSRQGKLITTMNHVLGFMVDTVEEGEFYDGELYKHGLPLQDLTSLIKKESEESKRVKLVLYDCIMDAPYSARKAKLEEKWGGGVLGSDPAVFLILSQKVMSISEANTKTDWYVAQGFEGGILRTPDKKYESGFRSSNLLKIKKFEDHEYEILKVTKGKDKDVNDSKLEVGVFLCKAHGKATFEVLAHGDQENKDYVAKNPKEFVGKFLTVRHSGFTKDGVPWHPVALQIKEDL